VSAEDRVLELSGSCVCPKQSGVALVLQPSELLATGSWAVSWAASVSAEVTIRVGECRCELRRCGAQLWSEGRRRTAQRALPQPLARAGTRDGAGDQVNYLSSALMSSRR
jgi:hypothetical protein